MKGTPLSSRRHIVIYGQTNAGKSTLFNRILGQDAVIVSAQKGTTTDPVIKAMELIPYGPVALVDTAGLGDDSAVGALRMKKTNAMLDRTDLALYAADCTDFDEKTYHETSAQFEYRETPHILVFTKADQATHSRMKTLRDQFPLAAFISEADDNSIDKLKDCVLTVLSGMASKEDTMIGNLLPGGATVVLVIPIDSEAPAGRLILPQVQLIRDCLDHGIQCAVCRETELKSTLENTRRVDLIVTDSKVFHEVSRIAPERIPLTSFSMILSMVKGDGPVLADGAKAIESLQNGDKILIAEGCTHNHNHEDIGRVVIPRLLRAKTGKSFDFAFFTGYDFPEDLSSYRLIIHCGGCMLTQKNMLSRIRRAGESNVPITNYGIAMAFLNGILPRTLKIFQQNKENA